MIAQNVNKGTKVTTTRSGTWQLQIGGYRAFLPHPLPPTNPTLNIDSEMTLLLSRADRAIGLLSGLAALVPNADLFVYLYVRKEALLSSQIEGTRCSLEDVFETDGASPSEHNKDVEEVSNYVRAMNLGLQRLKEIPVSSRLIREIHATLMAGVRGASKAPGEFRKTQVWIGMKNAKPETADFVPPPPLEVEPAMAQLEKFIHDENVFPELIRAALAHVQFETIHPFLDGNGRLGRLLITFLLCSWNVLDKPLLYLSYFFKAHRTEYYSRLNAVRRKGEWEEWVKFFLRGVEETATIAAQVAREIFDIQSKDRDRLRQGKAQKTALLAFEQFCKFPSASIANIAQALGTNYPRAQRAIETLVAAGILSEGTGKQRGRHYIYKSYFEVLRRDTILPFG